MSSGTRCFRASHRLAWLSGLLGLALATSAVAQVPGEISGVRIEKSGPGETLTFPYHPDIPGDPVKLYTVYRGRMAPDGFAADFGTMGHLREVADPKDGSTLGYTAINDTDPQGLDESYFFLVTATNNAGESSLGPGHLGPRGGVFGDPPSAAPDLYPISWNCEFYTGNPPPPFDPPMPPDIEIPSFDLPELCPPGMVPVPIEFAGLKGPAPDGGAPPPGGGGAASTGAGVEAVNLAETAPTNGGGMMGGYWYAWTQVSPPTPPFDDGAFSRFTVESPVIDQLPQTHSLAEIAIRSGPAFGDYVEVGWTVDRLVNNGSVAPSLFVFRWIGGVPAPAYNAGGFVQASTTVVPGMPLPVRSLLFGGYMYFGGDWWCFALTNRGGGWIGYFPGSLWGGSFTTTTRIQWFGEVWANNTPPANQMGNGVFGTSFAAPPLPAYINVLSSVSSVPLGALFYSFPQAFVTNNSYYDLFLFPQNPNGHFYYGGPG